MGDVTASDSILSFLSLRGLTGPDTDRENGWGFPISEFVSPNRVSTGGLEWVDMGEDASWADLYADDDEFLDDSGGTSSEDSSSPETRSPIKSFCFNLAEFSISFFSTTTKSGDVWSKII